MVEALRDNAPLLINAVLIVLVALASFLWLQRRQDMMFAWVALSGGLWIAYNLQFMPGLANGLHYPSLLALYLQPVAMAGFATCDCDSAMQRRLLWRAGGVFAALAVVHAIAERMGIASILLGTMFFLAACGLVAVVWRCKRAKAGSLDRAVLAAAAASLAGVVHDSFAVADAWNGLGLPAIPLAGLLSVTILTFVLGQRVLQALSIEENMNVLLANRVRAANASLMTSEAARRTLEVSGAITRERDRLMREIHDGIGSSLITAIAASEKQAKTADPVGVLKRALTDLRIAVDSLEPVQGDIATLLASLRYRVEPDLRKAGIAFDWQVETVQELGWLDPANALQILRIFQEAFSNIAAHAQATRIAVRCHSTQRDGRKGIAIEVSDNGKGFVDDGGPRGHGLRNMRRRAETVGAEFAMTSVPGEGTSVSVWLPDER